ncbi:MAG TPA: Gfo/Idh/MocA family oxidoreductase [Bauldia sp.]|nr:Gfo/Idh/MocA family oxidoreductase [Bauldia sp.]
MRLLILGTGSMAKAHALAFATEPDVQIVAAVEPNPERLAAFAAEHNIPNRFASLDEAIAWGEFDAAANVTPDGVHHPTTMQLIAARKHVFCEKPLATEYALAKEMADAAEAAGVRNMVNLTYRSSPALQKAREIVMSGEIGVLKHFEASYLQSWLVGNHWGDWKTEDKWLWRLSSAHGSKGVVGDIGIHVVDFATYAAASDVASLSSRIKTFDKAPGDQIGQYRLDANDSAVITVELANGALGPIQATRWATGNLNDIRLSLFGDKGALRVFTDGRVSSLSICAGLDVHTQTWRDVDCPPVPTNYQRFAAAVRSGVNGDPDFRRGAALQQVLDLCFAANGSGVLNVERDSIS